MQKRIVKMIAGFDLNDPLICEGIIGDGCGGGRIFMIEKSSLFAYDPITEEKLLLLEGVNDARSIAKSACIITIKTKMRDIFFNLSTLGEFNIKEKR